MTARQLPPQQHAALQQSVRLSRISLLVMVISAILVVRVAGESRAVQAALAEDLLMLVPPLVFLWGARQAGRPGDRRRPYGRRSLGHLLLGLALLAGGVALIFTNALALWRGERPSIGAATAFGGTLWAGWLMILVLVVTALVPLELARRKTRLARTLGDKVLTADADLGVTAALTGVLTVAGVVCVGYGLWWADALAALLVGAVLVFHAVRLLPGATGDLLDHRATELRGGEAHPIHYQLMQVAVAPVWVADAGVRVRDLGHVFHSEVFVVPRHDVNPTVAQIAHLQARLEQVDWKARDTVVAVVPELPAALR